MALLTIEEKKMFKQKIYAISNDLTGRKFSFNARDEIEANFKAEKWCDYHGMKIGGNFKLEETKESFDLHNEYIPKCEEI